MSQLSMKILWIALIAACLAIAVFLLLPKPKLGGSPAARPVVFTGQGISLTFPPGWTLQHEDRRLLAGFNNGHLVVLASNLVPAEQGHNKPEEASVVVYLLDREDARNTDDLYKRNGIVSPGAPDASNPDVHNIQIHELPLDGTSVKWCEWSSQGFSSLHAFVLSPSGKAYGLYFWSLESRMARHRQIYQDILKSIKVE